MTSRIGIVYKLHKNGLTYFGSTIMPLSYRISQHRCQKEGERVCASLRLFQGGDPEKEVLETMVLRDKSKEEIQKLRERENFYISNFQCINIMKATFDEKKWRKDNKERINKKQRERWNENSEKHKKKYQENKEQILIKKKIYRDENKDIINKKRRENKINCDVCGKEINKSTKVRHQKSKKCLSHK